MLYNRIQHLSNSVRLKFKDHLVKGDGLDRLNVRVVDRGNLVTRGLWMISLNR